MGQDAQRRASSLTDEFGRPLSSGAAPITEKIVHSDGKISFMKKQIVDDIIKGVANVEAPRRPKGDGVRYVGTVPILVCQIWAKECGAPVGSKEFNEYAHKKLTTGDFSKFKAYLQ